MPFASTTSASQNATRFPGVKLVVITPDAHFGYGVPVGSVILTDGTLAMGPVGYDIGCGMISARSDVPVGVATRDKRLAFNRAVMAGDTESGVTIMQMDEGLDTGAMAMREPLPILPDMTAGELHDALAEQGARLMPVTLAAAERGALSLTPQPEAGVIYAEKISKSETRIDWTRQAPEVHNHCRGLSPFPGAWFELDGVRVKALHTTMAKGSGAPGTTLDDKLTIACDAGAVRLTQVQRAGKQPMSADEFLRGAPVKRAMVLG